MKKKFKNLDFIDISLLVLIALCFLILCYYRLPRVVMDIDQIYHITISLQSPNFIIHNLISDDTNPGLAYFTFKGWMGLFSISENTIMHPPVVHGLKAFFLNPIVKLRFLPFLAFFLGCLLFGKSLHLIYRDKKISLLACLAPLLSPLLCEFGWSIRAQAFEFLGTISLFFFLFIFLTRDNLTNKHFQACGVTLLIFSFFRYLIPFLLAPSFILFILGYYFHYNKKYLRPFIVWTVQPYLLGLSGLIILFYFQKEVHTPLVDAGNNYLSQKSFSQSLSFLWHQFQNREGLFILIHFLFLTFLKRDIERKTTSLLFQFSIFFFLFLFLSIFASLLGYYPFSLDQRFSISLNTAIYLILSLDIAMIIQLVLTRFNPLILILIPLLFLRSIVGLNGYFGRTEKFGNCLDGITDQNLSLKNKLILHLENNDKQNVDAYHFWQENDYFKSRFGDNLNIDFFKYQEQFTPLDISHYDYVISDLKISLSKEERTAHLARHFTSREIQEHLSPSGSCFFYQVPKK